MGTRPRQTIVRYLLRVGADTPKAINLIRGRMSSGYAAKPVFDTCTRSVEYLLQQIYNRELALPDFQRNFVWDVKRSVELLRSIMCGFPVSSLLFWDQGGLNELLAQREIDGAPKLDGHKPAQLILDGQQRLTALYRALNDPREDRYFAKLDEFLAGEDLKEPDQIEFEDALQYVDMTKRLKFDPDSEDWQFGNLLFPLTELENFEKWVVQYSRRVATTDAEQDEVQEKFRKVNKRYLMQLKSYGLPVISLPGATPLEAVCKVFETLNSTGKPLGPFELLTAKFYPKKVNLRDLWQEALNTYQVLGTFDIDPYNVLQSITLRAKAHSAQRSDVLGRLTADDVTEHWPHVVSGYAGVLDLMMSDLGIIAKKWLPYSMILVPLAAVWAEVQDLKPLDRGAALDRLKQFFWCTVFTSNYDQGANSQAGADYAKLKEWLPHGERVKTVDLDAIEAPEAVKDFAFAATDLRTANVRRKALHAGVMALVTCEGAKDFHTKQKLTWVRAQQPTNQIDSHHIFPRKFLSDNGVSNSELILNRALIDSETNGIISTRAPSDYLEEMRSKQGGEALTDVLDSHAITSGSESGLERDNYENFLDERAQLIIQLIERATGKEVIRQESGEATNGV